MQLVYNSTITKRDRGHLGLGERVVTFFAR